MISQSRAIKKDIEFQRARVSVADSCTRQLDGATHRTSFMVEDEPYVQKTVNKSISNPSECRVGGECPWAVVVDDAVGLKRRVGQGHVT